MARAVEKKNSLALNFSKVKQLFNVLFFNEFSTRTLATEVNTDSIRFDEHRAAIYVWE